MVTCPSCGAQNEPTAATCARCFAPLSGAPQAPPPAPTQPVTYSPPPPPVPGMAAPPPVPSAAASVPNYLVQSILVTIFCCLPLGVAAIIFAAQVNTKLQAGDYAGAVEASKKAKMFCWIAVGLGVVGILLYILLFAGAMMSH